MFRRLPAALLGLGLLAAAARPADPMPVAGKTKAEWLKVLAEDASWRQRRAAVAALTIMEPRDRTMEDAVRGALKDKDQRVRLAAVDAVGSFVQRDGKGQ